MRNNFVAALASGALIFTLACSKDKKRQSTPLPDTAAGDWVVKDTDNKNAGEPFVKDKKFTLSTNEKGVRVLKIGDIVAELDETENAFHYVVGGEEFYLYFNAPTLDKDGQKMDVAVHEYDPTLFWIEDEPLVTMTLVRPTAPTVAANDGKGKGVGDATVKSDPVTPVCDEDDAECRRQAEESEKK